MRVAAFDLGSNSFHLLVADADRQLGISPIETKKELVRLGEQSLVAGIIPRPTLDRAMGTLVALRDAAARHHPDATRAVATSAVREARNRDEFIARARAEAGLAVSILPGREEARLCYLGALSRAPGAAAVEGRVALFDLGGGSLEIAVGEGDHVVHTASLAVGALRLARWLPDAGPCRNRIPALRGWLETHLRRAVGVALAAGTAGARALPFDRIAFSGGTARALARVAAFDDAPGSASRLAADVVRGLVDRLAGMSVAQRHAVPGIEPGRVDSIVPGALVIATLLELCGAADAEVCPSGLREGIVLDHVRRIEEAGGADSTTASTSVSAVPRS